MKVYTYEEALKESVKYFDNELAASVFVDKYALRNENNELLESNPDQMHRRIAREFARIEMGKFKEPIGEDEIYELLKGFKYIVPAGSPMYGIGNRYSYITLSNCYLLSIPLDGYSSILEVDKELVNISKRRGGVATDLSNLRPKNAPTKNAARSSTGITTWMERYSNSTREVAQKNRRGACLLSLSVHHPDIIDFCTIKNDLTKVTGANISVKLTQEFINALNSNGEHELRFPIENPTMSQKVKAKDIWNIIVDSSWRTGDPGLLFWNTIQKYTPSDCYEEYKAQGTNACQPSWAKLLTKDGIKTFNDVNIGDEIWSKEGWTKIVDKWSTGINKVYRYYFGWTEDNIIGMFEGTSNHKILSHGVRKEVKISNSCDCMIFGPPYPNLIEHECKGGYEWYVNPGVPLQHMEYVSTEETFDITVDNDSHTYWTQGCNVSNCSEIILDPLGSCKLMSLNLPSFVDNPFTSKATINYPKLLEYSKLMQRLMDDMIDLESEKIDLILKKIESDPEPDHIKDSEKRMWIEIQRKNNEGRRTGNGITGLGDVFASIGIKYGSPKSIEVTEEIYRTVKLGCYTASVEMSKELGPFKGWDYNKEKDHPFLLNIKEEDPELYKNMKKYGRRNVALTATAPTGSLSLLTQTTSGIEPLFELSHTRRRKINPEDNVHVDFVDKSGDKWQEYKVIHPQTKRWMQVTEETDLEKSPWFGCCANDVSYKSKIKLLSVAQKHTCHNISCTFNLPSTSTREDIDKIYRLAMENGLKGITVYRDGSRSGVLIRDKSFPKDRPKELECDVHHITVRGTPFMVLVGLIEGQPYEVFAVPNGNLSHDVKKGKIVKILRPRYYKAVLDDGMELSPINTMCSDYEDAITRLVSVNLQNKTEILKVVQQLEKVNGDISSFAKSIARALKKYIKDGTKEGVCPECGEDSLVRESGCQTCKNCAWSKCQ